MTKTQEEMWVDERINMVVRPLEERITELEKANELKTEIIQEMVELFKDIVRNP
jgi:hypothetical protein